ncbi:hypothetical protein D1007_34403 [Hordeum vulgare]|nr:hypothetical protein D1007_34403 [Hordeum vulgare]
MKPEFAGSGGDDGDGAVVTVMVRTVRSCRRGGAGRRFAERVPGEEGPPEMEPAGVGEAAKRDLGEALAGPSSLTTGVSQASKVFPTLNPNISHDDDVDDNGDEDNDEESDNIASLKIKGEISFKYLYKNKLACSNFLEIMSIATEGKKYIEELEAHLEEHEATIETMEGHERDYANEIAELSQALENEQTTKESLKETFALELSRLKGSHDSAL